jgi:hypothetical protein
MIFFFYKSKFKFKAGLIILLFFSNVTVAQTSYNKACISFDLAMGNGIYGWTSLKVGGELPLFKHQKVEGRFGFGFDIGKKIGFGLSISPYTLEKWDFKVNCDLTRVFGSTYTYYHEEPYSSTETYSFDNTNLVIPSITCRLILMPQLTFNLTTGWAIRISTPNIQHLSGPNHERSVKNIHNRLIGGKRFEFGGTIRLGKWDTRLFRD